MEELALITLASSLIGGLFGTGTSDKEAATKEFVNNISKYTDFFKKAPFTKDELFNTILPQVQGTFRGGADVAAGRLGSLLGEAGLAKGGGYKDSYLNALAPVIAQGETNAANAQIDFAKLFANMDLSSKQQLLQLLGLQGNAIQGLNDTTKGQDFFTNFLQAGQIGSTVGGNIMSANSLEGLGNSLKDLIAQLNINANPNQVQNQETAGVTTQGFGGIGFPK